MRHCHALQDFSGAGRAWLGELCKGSHHLLLRRPGGVWHFALWFWPGSCVLALRARSGVLPRTDLSYFEPDLSTADAFSLIVVAEVQGRVRAHPRRVCGGQFLAWLNFFAYLLARSRS